MRGQCGFKGPRVYWVLEEVGTYKAGENPTVYKFPREMLEKSEDSGSFLFLTASWCFCICFYGFES